MAAQDSTAEVLNVQVARSLRHEWLFRLNRGFLYALMLLYVPAVLALVAALLGAGYWLTSLYLQGAASSGSAFALLARVGLFVLVIDLALLVSSVVLLFGLLPLFFRRVESPTGGERLIRPSHPNFFGLLDRICKRMNVRPPDQVILDPFDNASISDIDEQIDDGSVNRDVRTLVIGAGLVVHLRVDELATILCHEIAHAATGDTRMGLFADRFYRSLVAAISGHAEDNRGWIAAIVYYILVGYAHLFSLVYLADSRYREYRADRIAAEICGPQNVRNALTRSMLLAYLPNLRIGSLLAEYAANEREMKNLYAEHRRRWEQIPEHRRAEAESAMFMETGKIWDSHPPLSKRIRNLADVTAREWQVDRPAADLFRAWQGYEEKMTQQLVAFGRAFHDLHMRQIDRELRLGRP